MHVHCPVLAKARDTILHVPIGHCHVECKKKKKKKKVRDNPLVLDVSSNFQF